MYLVGRWWLQYRRTDSNIIFNIHKQIKYSTNQCSSPFFEHQGCERQLRTIRVNVCGCIVVFITPLLFEFDSETCKLSIQVGDAISVVKSLYKKLSNPRKKINCTLAKAYLVLFITLVIFNVTPTWILLISSCYYKHHLKLQPTHNTTTTLYILDINDDFYFFGFGIEDAFRHLFVILLTVDINSITDTVMWMSAVGHFDDLESHTLLMVDKYIWNWNAFLL